MKQTIPHNIHNATVIFGRSRNALL